VHLLTHVGKTTFDSASRTSHLFEALRARSRRFELLAIRGVHGLLRTTDIVRRVLDEHGESFEHLTIELERFATTGGLGSFAGSSFESLLDLRTSLLDQTTSFSEFGVTPCPTGRELEDGLAYQLERESCVIHLGLSRTGVAHRAFEIGQLSCQDRQLFVKGLDLDRQFIRFIAERRLGDPQLFEQPTRAFEFSVESIQFGFGLRVLGIRSIQSLPCENSRLVARHSTLANRTDHGLGFVSGTFGFFDR
jgi:hypothetical protein